MMCNMQVAKGRFVYGTRESGSVGGATAGISPMSAALQRCSSRAEV